MDIPGLGFAAFLLMCAAAFGIVLYRSWSSLENERFFGTVLVVSTMLLGVVLIARYTGRMGDGPAYQTLDVSLSTLSTVMLVLVFLAERRRRRPGATDEPV
jgi:hypothetical protein